jgi:hypothetical protein
VQLAGLPKNFGNSYEYIQACLYINAFLVFHIIAILMKDLILNGIAPSGIPTVIVYEAKGGEGQKQLA